MFCGPNNTGKTYASFIIYALTKGSLKYLKYKNQEDVVQDLIRNQESKFILNVDDIWHFRKEELSNLKRSLSSIFGISEEVEHSLFENFNINIKQTKKEFESQLLEMNFENDLDIRDLLIKIIKKKGEMHIGLSSPNKSFSKDSIEFLELFLSSKLYSLTAFYPFTSSFILPVERNSIYTFSKEVSIQKQEFLERAQELGSKKINRDPFHWLMRRLTRYPLPISDGLEIADDLYNISKTKTQFHDFAEEIESDLLGGKVVVNKDGDVQYSSSKSKRKKIPIHLTASIVKTLSSLVFYLKHIANPNDLIIIDEPELNLHPNNQVLITRLFTRLISKGFRLVLSTHSDYIIRELNNLIMFSSAEDTIVKKNDYKEYKGCGIKHDLVGAYMFNFKNRSSKTVDVKSIEVNKFGFEVSTIDDTIDSINSTSEELFYLLKYPVLENE